MPARPPPRRTRDRAQAGFTMLELLVTLAIMVIGLTGMLGLQLASTRANQGASQTAEAVTVAQRTLEEARSKTLAQLLADYDDDGVLPIEHDFDAQTVVGRTTTYLRQITVEETAASPDLLRVRVEVTWADDGAVVGDPDHTHTVAAELLRTRQEAF